MFITALHRREYNQIITRDLVRWYPMNEGSGSTLHDRAGGSYNATLAGTYAWEAPGVDFDGSTTYATASRTGAHPTGSFTVTARIRPDGWGQANYGRILQAGVQGSQGFWCYVNNSGGGGAPPGIATVSISYNANVNATANNSILSLGTLAHVSIVYIPGNGISFYIDGSLNVVRNSATLPTIIENTSVDIVIGDRNDQTRKFDGMISDVRLYHRALSATEIAAIAAGQG